MTDHDLTQIGIEAFGARRRMQQAIAGRLLKKQQHQTFSYELQKEYPAIEKHFIIEEPDYFYLLK